MRDSASLVQNAVVLAAVLVGLGFATWGVSVEAVRYGVLAVGCVAAVMLLMQRAGRKRKEAQRRAALERAVVQIAERNGAAPSGPPAQAPAAPRRGGTDTEVLQRVLAQTRKAVGFRPVFPPRHPMEGLTFFGGRPIGPKGLRWPSYVGEDRRKAALFMGQVAVRDLPAVEELEGLDEDLVLYFFLPLTYDPDAMGGMVVTASGDPDGWTEIAPPENASDLGSLSFMDSWSKRSGRAMMTFPKWEMEPAVVESLPGSYDMNFFQMGVVPSDKEQPRRVQGMVQYIQRIAWGTVFTQSAPRPTRLSQDCTMDSLAERIPQVWLSVEALTAWILGRLDLAAEVNRLGLEGARKAIDEAKRGADASGRAMEMALRRMDGAKARAEATGPLIAPLRDKVQPWFDRARGADPFAPVDASDWAGFLTLIDDIRTYHPGHKEMPGRLFVTYATEMALQVGDMLVAQSSETLERLTDQQVQALAHRHVGRRGSDAGYDSYDLKQHQMFGTPVDIQGTGPADDVLLMQFVYDEGMDWQIGDAGAAQYWISRADLAAGRFDRVTLTVEGH